MLNLMLRMFISLSLIFSGLVILVIVFFMFVFFFINGAPVNLEPW